MSFGETVFWVPEISIKTHTQHSHVLTVACNCVCSAPMIWWISTVCTPEPHRFLGSPGVMMHIAGGVSDVDLCKA